MLKRIFYSTIVASVLTTVFIVGTSYEQPRMLSAEEALAESRRVTKALLGETKAAMKSYLEQGGLIKAVRGCSVAAQEIARSYNESTGYYIRRVSLKYRNPMNRPDRYEEKRLKRFNKLRKKGMLPDDFEDYEIVEEDGGRYLRYMKPLITKKFCLNCHGSKDEIPDDVERFLAERYPGDRATGFKVGDVRGAVSVKIPVRNPDQAGRKEERI